MTQILVVEDQAGMRGALEANFRLHGWKVQSASGVEDAIAKFRYMPCPLVVTDVRMPDGDGLQVMRRVREIAPETAVIFLTAYGNVPEAVAAMQEGACDYLIKPVSFERLKNAAERILMPQKNDAPECPLVGKSPALMRLLDRARRVSSTEADVLVEAESGTGKELLARFIHDNGPRRSHPFVAVNCAAFPETLLESELFGHVRGAFTGAAASKLGKFELANRGTILLDEIGEMPMNLQPKLLRALQEREIDRLGDTKPVRVNVRVIATTNRSLRALVDEGRFRADLYYRLNVVPLSIPALRDRREDIQQLAEHFVRKHYKAAGRKEAPRLGAELLDQMQSHDWPGNIRELENFIRRALALSIGPTIGLDWLQDPLSAAPESSVKADRVEAGMSWRDAEKQLLMKTLEATEGNRTRAAEMLGMSLRTVRNKIREYGLPARVAMA